MLIVWRVDIDTGSHGHRMQGFIQVGDSEFGVSGWTVGVIWVSVVGL